MWMPSHWMGLTPLLHGGLRPRGLSWILLVSAGCSGGGGGVGAGGGAGGGGGTGGGDTACPGYHCHQ